jgi:CDP-6-deoxy-D-xylo-4-hexulose-3-dehydrase
MDTLRQEGVEFRRGTAGGGNQVRQPYLQGIVEAQAWKQFPNADHVHFNGFYIGNYPSLEHEQILWLCRLLNSLGEE